MQGAVLAGHYICYKIMQTVFILERTYHATVYARACIQHIFYFFGFYSLAKNHYLFVASMQKCYIAVGHFISEVAAAVHAGTVVKCHKVLLLGDCRDNRGSLLPRKYKFRPYHRVLPHSDSCQESFTLTPCTALPMGNVPSPRGLALSTR